MICNECETVAHCLKHGCVPKQALAAPPAAQPAMTHITIEREALELALEALEGNTTNPVIDPDQAAIEDQAIAALKQALAAPVQPMAHIVGEIDHTGKVWKPVQPAPVQDGLCGHESCDCRSYCKKQQPAPVQPVAQAWDEGYRAGIDDERTSEANIGIAGFDAKVEPARNNPYRTTSPAQPVVQSCYCPNCEAVGKELAALKAQPAPANLWLYWKVDNKSVITGPFKTHSKDEAYGLDCIDQTQLTVPAAQPAVPDAMTSADIQEHIEYVTGWNDCRQAMLEMMK